MSEPLQPSDPSRIAGFRLLRRLGAGGMGVVYLGRTDSGALAAVKVIRGESAGDDDFRARFAREVDLARRVDSPWVTPLLDADAEARDPWLATAFVPGPSVAEAVAAHGPLPPRAVHALGGLLAEALTAVHTAGLVHRDVKPANVLLAVDGPRLIDFGIARAVGATALTTDGTVVGSPGYLSPEQARGRTVGPPSDVFSLGCVLARTGTGRPPFGTGGAAAVRTGPCTSGPTWTACRRPSTAPYGGVWRRNPSDGRPRVNSARPSASSPPTDASPRGCPPWSPSAPHASSTCPCPTPP